MSAPAKIMVTVKVTYSPERGFEARVVEVVK